MKTMKKEREKVWGREYVKVMGCNFLLFFAFYLLTPLLPLYLDAEFHADKDLIGVILSGYVVATLVARPFSGLVVDSFDRKKVLMLCFFFFFLCFSGYLGASSLLMFFIVRTIHGIPFGATTVANSTVAIDVLPASRRNEGIGYYGLSNNVAMAVAPSVGIYLYHATESFEVLFWLALGIAFFGFLLSTRIRVQSSEFRVQKLRDSGEISRRGAEGSRGLFRIQRSEVRGQRLRDSVIGEVVLLRSPGASKERREKVAHCSDDKIYNSYNSYKSYKPEGRETGDGGNRCSSLVARCSKGGILSHLFLGRAWLLAVNICFFGACWGLMSNYVALYGKQELGITDGTGVFFMILSAGLFVSRLFGAKSLRAGRMTHNASVGVMVSLVGYCLFAFVVTPWSFYLSAALIGLGNGQMYPAFLNMFVKVARRDQRGTANSSILISWDLGMGLGILIGGVVAENLGFREAFYVTAGMQGAGAVLFIFFTKGFFERRKLDEN